MSGLKVKIALLLGSLSLALLLGEILVRLTRPYNSPDTHLEYSLQSEPSLFSASLLKPVDRLVEVDPAKAMGIKGRHEPAERTYFINRNGTRGRGFSRRKPSGTTRVLILGGSAVFDPNVFDADSIDTNDWPHRVERLLKSMGFDGVEVVNAGIPGHSTVDSFGRLYSQLWLYEPDVIVVYQTWNDIKYWSNSAVSPSCATSAV
jgi:hypothetical protein